MPKVGHALRTIERPNVRANTSVQPIDRALRSFAQECLERMKYQLDWVEVRRIFRQVAQACTGGMDRLLHTSNLVKWDVVDHHNIPTLEGGSQTLLYISQEGLSIHGSF